MDEQLFHFIFIGKPQRFILIYEEENSNGILVREKVNFTLKRINYCILKIFGAI